ncbi:hypothetical protein DL96DRAFT_1559900 [Flagelloscypha sp. PMI_526]|nr:hypothetical protein DL96DRAFT_1559900 [Flagelloscypha sp. PMI_526]
MLTPAAGTVQEPLLEPLSLAGPAPNRVGNGILMGKKFYNDDGTPRTPGVSPPNSKAVYISAILAAVFFSLISQLVLGIPMYLSWVREGSPEHQWGRRQWYFFLRDSRKSQGLRLILNIIFGEPLYMVLSGLILRNGFPELELKDLVLDYLIAVPIVAVGMNLRKSSDISSAGNNEPWDVNSIPDFALAVEGKR